MTPGSRIGPYEVVAPLGAGGMGEVYRARDTRLNRDVALKILPAAFTADPDRAARFEREAQALAALNHPNIAQVYGIEAGGPAIVMELVDGEDLSALIRRKFESRDSPFEVLEWALPIARQVALALEAAHDAGIVHRDLKPGNIKVRQDGVVKVLDFGLAKAIASGDPDARDSASKSPTLTARATALGVVLGTAAYMAPEQAKGKPVDRRADVWAFGAVLYEMLTGRRAFAGDDVTEVMAAVIRDTPSLDALPAGTPAPIRRLLRRCFEKDPRKRLRDMGDAGVELDEAMSGQPAEAPRAAGAATARPPRWSSGAVIAGALALAALAAVAAWLLKPEAPVDRPLTRFAVALPEGHEFGSYAMPNLALSRDGRRLAYRTRSAIFVRNLDETEPRAVAKAPGSGLWFSPNGDTLLYGTTAGLSRVPAAGGPSLDLVEAPAIVGADWAEDGTIVYATGSTIERVSEDGGQPQTVVDKSQGPVIWPQVLAGGRLLLFTRASGEKALAMSTVVRSLDDGREQVVLPGVGGARYVETGHLVYGQEDRLLAVPFDPDTRATTGKAMPMPETVYVSGQSSWAQAAMSRNGTLVYLPSGGVETQSQLVWSDNRGQVSTVSTPLRVYSDPQLSPDGRRVAIHLWDEENDVWVADLVRGGLTRLTFTPSEEETPVWSPDGLEVAYAATRPGQPRTLYRRGADGSAAAVERKVWEHPDHFHVNDWSPDGRTIIVEVRQTNTANDLFAIDVASGKGKPVLASPFPESQARFSPDGKWLAYTSVETGRAEVYVQPYPALDRRMVVSTAGGYEPIWSSDGRRLFYRSKTGVMAAAVTSSSPLEFSAPEALFDDRFVRPQGDFHTHYDVAPDGRFLFIQDPRQGQVAERVEIQVVLNWAETVKRLAPRR